MQGLDEAVKILFLEGSNAVLSAVTHSSTGIWWVEIDEIISLSSFD